MELYHGFFVTIQMATVSLVFAIIIGLLFIYLMQKENRKIAWLTEVGIKVAYGIPLIVFIPFLYYSSWRLGTSAMLVAILILSMVGAGDLSLRVKSSIDFYKLDLDKNEMLKIVLIKSLGEWSRLINVTAFFSILGIREFSRVARRLMSSEGRTYILGFAVIVYVMIHIIMMVIESNLMKAFIGKTEKRNIKG